jgi:4-alpha-glucanotransferase
MQITFRIHYATAYGQRVELLVDDSTPQPLDWAGGGWWRTTIDLEPGTAYRYRVVLGGEVATVELGPTRSVPQTSSPVIVVDRWRPPDSARLSRRSAFFRRARGSQFPGGATTDAPAAEDVTLRLIEPAVPRGHRPAVVGAAAALGAWDIDRAVPLEPSPYPWWEAHIGAAAGAYKYVLLDSEGSVADWETGPDRMLPDLEGARTVIVNDDEIRGLAGWRGAGVAIPVFALRSGNDVGVGQFTDLESLADWAADVGLSVIQLLPVNDTVLNHDWDDSYPYNPTSVQALHPLYIDLEDVAGTDESLRADIEKARREVNELPEIDYVRVMELKWGLLRAAYATAAPSLDQDDDFAEFVDREWEWLGPYSAWCVLRDRNGTPDFRTWGEHGVFAPGTVTAMATPGAADYDDLRFHWFVQFHLHRQLTRAADYARSRGVALKGDLPIGVAPESAEVWTMPKLFHVGAQTGAPPDAFAVRGQNWEFPTYDWDRMAADGYRWWRARFAALARYVDVYRIDHVLGFFRIWEVPHSADDGLLGYFRPSLPLSEGEVRAALGDVDLGRLVRPLIDPAGLEARFAAHAGLVRAEFFEETDGLLGLGSDAATQRRIMEAFDRGALAALPQEDRDVVRRALLDVAAEVLLVAVDGGYQPRISWEATEHYHRLTADQQVRFDALAIDFFHHRHTAQWEQQGRTTLPAVVAATDLLACGEDLGMVPDLVPRLMNEMGLLSLEIERMPKRLGAWIADPAEAPYLSVVSPSTHDTTTIRMWWEEDRALIERYWREALRREGDPPATATPEVCEAIMRRQLASPAMLCVIPISDLLAMDGELRREEIATERINDPANRHNKWRYRLQLTLDELAAADDFNARLRSVLREHGR